MKDRPLGRFYNLRAILETIPNPAKRAIIAVPPWLTNGKGIPVKGARPETAAILMNAWPTIQVLIPTTSNRPNLSDVFFAIETRV